MIPTIGALLDLVVNTGNGQVVAGLAGWLLGAIAVAIVIRAIGDALWRSMPADELKFWIFIREGPREDRFWMLNWEVRNRERYQPGRIQNPQMTQPVPLTPQEVAEKRAELRAIAKASLGIRILKKLLTCTPCQQFWTALAIVAAWNQGGAVWDVLATAFLYGYVSTRLGRAREERGGQNQNTGARMGVGCAAGNCGGG
jgi:hypothetical protein